jgi:primosomal protein N' (replication factor Y)
LSQLLFHPVLSEATFATVIIPIAVPKAYTYIIPEELIDDLHFGMRVEVQFGKSKLYAGLVIDIHKNQPENYKPKPLLSIIDKQPIISKEQFSLWKWIAQYYCCMIGEVMNAALPAGLKLNSETTITLSSVFEDNFEVLNDKEYLIAEALTIQDELKIKDVQNILNQKNVYPIINKLLEKRVVFLK